MSLRGTPTSVAGASGTSAAPAVPAGAATNDIAVVGIYLESTATITAPSGFTNKANLATSATARGRLAVYWKRLTGADSGTYSFTWTGSAWRSAACGLWSGRVTTGDPFDGTVGTAESTSGVTTLNVSTSPAASGGDAVGFWTNFNGGAGFTPPTNYTEQVDTSVLTMDTRDNVAAGSTGSLSATASITDFMKAFLGVLAPAGGGGTALNFGLAAETDTAQALGSSKLWLPPSATETDTARTIILVKTPTYAASSEADTARAATLTKAPTYPAAAETDTAQAWTTAKAQTYAAGSETDTAWAMTFSKGLALAAASETDTAQAASFSAGGGTALSLARATEADTAQALTASKAWTGAAGAETDLALPVGLTKAPTLARATEAGTALAMTFSKGLALASAAETDTARQLVGSKLLALSVAAETDTALVGDFGGLPAYETPSQWTVQTRKAVTAIGTRSNAHSATTRRAPYTARTRAAYNATTRENG